MRQELRHRGLDYDSDTENNPEIQETKPAVKKDANKKKHKRSASDTDVINLASGAYKPLDELEQFRAKPALPELKEEPVHQDDSLADIQRPSGGWVLPRPEPDDQSLVDYILDGKQ